MQSEEKIRAYRDALAIAVVAPCSCDETGHAEECRLGGLAMSDAVNTLSWILGDMDAGDAIAFENRVRRFIEATS